MESEFFYTYSFVTGGAIFNQGYKDGKRVRYIIGKFRSKNPKRTYRSNKFDLALARSRRWDEYSDTLYIRAEQYNKYRNTLNSYLTGAYGPIPMLNSDYGWKLHKPMRFNLDCDKVDIFGNQMVEVKYDLADNNNFLWWAKENGIDLYNNIECNNKLMDLWSNRKDFKVDYHKIKIGFIDIETEMEHGQMDTYNCPEVINVITLKIKGGKIYTFCVGKYKNDNPNVEVYSCKTEKQMLRTFLDKWEEIDLDVISDWNGLSFDIPYIFRRCLNILGVEQACRLSPFGLVEERDRKSSFGKPYLEYKIIGINHLDYMELYVDYSHTPQSSYSLNNICNYELGKGKLDYSEYGSLHRLYKNDFQKFVDYNIRDVTLLEDLDDKLQMIHLAMSIAYKCRCGFEDTGSQIRIWDSFIYSDFMKKNWVLPPKKEISESERGELMGGYVKLPKKAGTFSNIVSFDVNSLYPTIIRQLNLSPDTITDEVDERFKDEYGWLKDENGEFLRDSDWNKIQDPDDLHHLKGFINCTYDCSEAKKKNMVFTCNGNFIRKDKQGFLPKMVGDLYGSRVEVKKKMKKSKQQLELVKKELEERGSVEEYKDFTVEQLEAEQHKLSNEVSSFNNEQMAIKILLNALYGQLSNRFCRWFDIRIPRSITCTGQTMIRYIARRINELVNEECGTKDEDYVLTIDTDSNYINLDGVYHKRGYKSIDDLNDYIENVLEPYIDKCYREFYDYMNHFDFQMVMKREAISDRGLFINKKKRYCLSVIDMEGVRYAHPKLKIVGLEVIKSSTPEGCKDALMEVLRILLYKNRGDLVRYIEDFKEKFFHMTADQIGLNRNVSDMNKWMETIKIDDDTEIENESYYKNVKKAQGEEVRNLGTPINVRAAMNFNNIVDKYKLNLQKITVGEKIKMIYLKPNPYGIDIIGFIDYLPAELKLEQFIDYEKQFDKAFLTNVHNITDDLNYNLELEYDAEDLGLFD